MVEQLHEEGVGAGAGMGGGTHLEYRLTLCLAKMIVFDIVL